ncbi:hypothetical protein DFH07DRAFT_953122 [Mycena maculata]|uniref:Uncharacterized protein n=1 Tax=Mycena maculata TaxID=230809 RepID=A0AAD7JVK2_9AGAR|nr:hypothetical protein DFH07DRAFT_953122 [Mycena maculata]
MGASIVMFLSSKFKREEVMRLRVSEFYATKDVAKFEIGVLLSHLIVNTSFLPNWRLFLSIMKLKGIIFLLTISFTDLVVPIMLVVLAGTNIQGLVVSACSVHKRMLNFAACNHIEPVIVRFPLTNASVEEVMVLAYEHLGASPRLRLTKLMEHLFMTHTDL